MICRHCGKDNRLTKEERSARQKEALRLSPEKIGAKRKIDYDLVLAMRKSGCNLKEIAHQLNCTVPGVSRVLKKFEPVK